MYDDLSFKIIIGVLAGLVVFAFGAYFISKIKSMVSGEDMSKREEEKFPGIKSFDKIPLPDALTVIPLLMMVGGAGLFLVGYMKYTIIEEGILAATVSYSLKAGVVVSAAYTLLLFQRYTKRGVSKGMLTFLGLLLFIGFMFLIGGYYYSSNGLLDESPGQTHIVTVRGMTAKRTSSDNKPSYYISFDSWKPGYGEVTMGVSPEKYVVLRTGDRVSITVKPGYRGFEWIESFEPI